MVMADTSSYENFYKELTKRLRDALVELASSSQKSPLLNHRNELIDSHLRFICPLLFCTPDHPPYSLTMHQAIEALNEEGGSTEQSISSHIRPQHHELPCSHKAFLSHHPKRLTDQGQLLVTPQGTYTLPNQHIPRPCGEDQREQTQRTGLASVLRWPKRWQEEAAQHQRTRGKPIWRHVTAREAEGRRSEGKCRKES